MVVFNPMLAAKDNLKAKQTGNDIQSPTTGVGKFGLLSTTMAKSMKQPTPQATPQAQPANNGLFQFKAPEAFSYDQNTDPAYQAALATAKSNITQSQADTNAFLRARGQGKSSYSDTVANSIASKEMGRVSTDVLPQLISQAYQRYSDNANRDLQVQQGNYGVQQDNITNTMREAELTGDYLPPAARQALQNLSDYKTQTEKNWQTMTPAQRVAARLEGDRLREAASNAGAQNVDSLFGADVKATNTLSNFSQAARRTVAASAQDYAQEADKRDYDRGVVVDDRNFNRGNMESDRNYDRSVFESDRAYDQWREEFNQRVEQDGEQNALAWASRDLQKRGMDEDEAFRWAQLDYQTGQGGDYSGLSANQVLDRILPSFTEPIMSTPGAGGTPEKIGEQLTKDPAKREELFIAIAEAGMPDAMTDQAWAVSGLSAKEIKALKEKYGLSGNK